MDRRRFLAALSATLVAPQLTAREAKGQTAIVIGAGVAGLAASQELRKRGISVTVLEARDRIGGRIHTSRIWPGLPVDLGASWIHGTHGNPLTALAAEAGAQTHPTSYDSAQLYIAPALAAIGVGDLGTEWAQGIVTRARRRAEAAEADMSLRAAVDLVSPPAGRSPIRRAQLDHHLAGNFEQEYAGNARELSAWWVDEDKAFSGDDAIFPQGYDQIAHHLARGLDIRLNQPVTKVRWGKSGVEVGLFSGETVAAGRAIVTVPLGVLKAGDIRFTPELPAAYRSAINRLGMGLLNKHFLRFDKPFWPADIDWHECLKPEPGKWSQWVSFAKTGAPMLLGFTGADAAREVEHLETRAIVADATATLRDMFGSRVPEPLDAQVTRWSKDRFAGGSYSFYAVGSSPEDRRALSRPLADGALSFAGEACSPDYPGTVHGALLSGRVAARHGA